MEHLHNFGEFEQIFYATIDGAFDMDDIHQYYICYKENEMYEAAEDFLRFFFEDCVKERSLIYLKESIR